MQMGDEEDHQVKWLNHYSSNHEILLIGDGDFSFSLSLATFFGSAPNILSTSLDSFDEVTKKYKEAKSNLIKLGKLGACVLHGVDATKMKLHTDLSKRKFDRIVFNFPHAGFRGQEDNKITIHRHRMLVNAFFSNAKSMLRPFGEIHVSHKTTPPFSYWRLDELASSNSLVLVDCVEFKIEDYPCYKQKRGASLRCDEPFPLGQSSTFKFRFSPSMNNIRRKKEQTLSNSPLYLDSVPPPKISNSFELSFPQPSHVNPSPPLISAITIPPRSSFDRDMDFLPLKEGTCCRIESHENNNRFGFYEDSLMINGRMILDHVRSSYEFDRRASYPMDPHVSELRNCFGRDSISMNEDRLFLPEMNRVWY